MTPISPVVLTNLFADPTGTALVWQPFRPGITAAWIYQTPGGGPAAALLRYQPGAGVPLHRHPGWEHILILEGSQNDGTTTHGPGTLIASPPESQHRIRSDKGCLALLVWERAPQILDS
jgi:anti-sigma factor ChrR (cupin superfamily)